VERVPGLIVDAKYAGEGKNPKPVIKSEIRNQKSEGNPKPEIRKGVGHE
jgi:hypothetical protein